MNNHFLLSFLFLFGLSFSVNSFGFDEYLYEDLEPLIVTGEAIGWEEFATTKEDMSCVTYDDGFEDCLIKPIYSDEIKSLDKKEVTLMGFMFPLDPTEMQQNFLIGPYPISCPFTYHVGPSQIVEVKLNKPIEFSFDPVVVKGVFSVEYNKETGVFYYLNQ